jgi:hypothetical protein
MRFLQYEFDTDPGDIIRVELDKQANVLLLDGPNFSRYRNGQSYHYHGGLAKRSPVDLVPPHAGHWYVVINRGGYPGTVRVSVRVLTTA